MAGKDVLMAPDRSVIILSFRSLGLTATVDHATHCTELQDCYRVLQHRIHFLPIAPRAYLYSLLIESVRHLDIFSHCCNSSWYHSYYFFSDFFFARRVSRCECSLPLSAILYASHHRAGVVPISSPPLQVADLVDVDG